MEETAKQTYWSLADHLFYGLKTEIKEDLEVVTMLTRIVLSLTLTITLAYYVLSEAKASEK